MACLSRTLTRKGRNSYGSQSLHTLALLSYSTRCISLPLPSDLNLLSLSVILFCGDHHEYSYSIQKAEMLDGNLLGKASPAVNGCMLIKGCL